MNIRHSILLITVCAVIVYATWADGFSMAAARLPLLPLTLIMAMALMWSVQKSDRTRWRRDPVFWGGFFFLLFVGVQTWNAGRLLYLNPVSETWIYTAPPFPWLPGSFSSAESAEMLALFAPAWILALTLRHAQQPERLARCVLGFMMVNGVLLAVFAVVQHLAGSEHLLWRRTVTQQQFYGTFGYRNHAGAYFVLVLALALGSLHNQLRIRWAAGEKIFSPVMWALAGSAAILFIAIHPALSRAGITLAWILILLFGGHLLAHKTHTQSPSEKLLRASVMILCAGIVLSWIAVFGGAALVRRMDGFFVDTFMANIQTRSWMWAAAWQMWEDHKLWGVGGWGYRYLAPLYANEAGLLQVHLPGKANAHNDPLQFLAEFGLVGVVLWGTIVSVWGVRFVRAWRYAWGRPAFTLYTMTASGLFLVGLHSLFDLPFRNPAVLLAWVALLAGVPAAKTQPMR